MLRRALARIARYPYALAFIVIIGILVFIFTGISRSEPDLPEVSTAQDPASLPVSSQSASGDFGLAMPSDNPLDAQPPGGNARLSSMFASCPPELTWFPQAFAASGFTPAEQPARQRLESIKQISVGHVFDGAGYGSEYGVSYALKEDGTVYRWGVTDWSRQSRPSAFPQKVNGLPGSDSVMQLEGRFALLQSGDVYDLNAENGAKQIEHLPKAASIAQAEDSSVYIVGRDGSLQLYSLFGPESIPAIKQVSGLDAIRSIKASPFMTLALDADGKLLLLQSPFGSYQNDPASRQLELPDGARAVRLEAAMSSDYPGFVLSDQGNWFLVSAEGKLEAVPGTQETVRMTASQKTVLAMKEDGTVWAWGESSNLFPTDTKRVGPDQPRPIAGLTNIRAIAAGTDHLLALTGDGYVLTMGSNMYGQLGRLPIYAADPQPLGSWPGAEALFAFENRLMAVIGGDLWALSYNRTAQPVVLGQKVHKAFAALGHFAALTEDGRLLVADPEETKPCRLLQVNGSIMDAAAAANGILLAMTDGHLVHLEGNTRELSPGRELSLHPKPKGKAVRVFGEPVPFVLTDQGELYSFQRTENGTMMLELVDTPSPVKEWSPIHYDYSEGIGFRGKLLDAANQVIEVEIKLNHRFDEQGQTAEVSLRLTGRQASGLTGGAELGQDGRIYEQGSHVPIDTHLPPGVQLRASTSLYHHFIEGRSYFYHFFAAKDGSLYWLGDWPDAGAEMSPGVVVLP
ncbi:RCC1 domain-containing protein [Paenibacillus sp. OAS669]|uniref:RCC1 domain-containing protein n=1 Tax=Paenibacillus sp. OAS669 TaxID=2663821 RepID=UPI001789B275|nr:hypothetical protein [Paenibacillus sp. OAS669]MBE1444673.1 alpha-tubulin suppressor-like RCC1 family protein [Paenibacillus sp. OAS669]